jgi:hypothetical protein
MHKDLRTHTTELKENSFGEFSVIRTMVMTPFKNLLPPGTKTSNTANPPLERAIKKILEKSEFSEILRKDYLQNIKYKPKQFQDILEKDYPLPYHKTKKWFIHQPCGTQASPDFIVAIDNQYICLDLKGNMVTEKIMWNSGEICTTYFYICVFPGGTYYFVGRDYPVATTKTLVQVRLNMKETDKINNELLKNDPNNRTGQKIVSRPAWFMDPLSLSPSTPEWLAIMDKAETFAKGRAKSK